MGECHECHYETNCLEEHHYSMMDPTSLKTIRQMIYLCPPCGHLYTNS